MMETHRTFEFPGGSSEKNRCVCRSRGFCGAIAARAADSAHINGWISDSMCGAKHAGSGAACVKKCIEGGMAPVFVDEAEKGGLDHRQPRRGEGLLWRSCDHSRRPPSAAKKSVHIDSIAAAK